MHQYRKKTKLSGCPAKISRCDRPHRSPSVSADDRYTSYTIFCNNPAISDENYHSHLWSPIRNSPETYQYSTYWSCYVSQIRYISSETRTDLWEPHTSAIRGLWPWNSNLRPVLNLVAALNEFWDHRILSEQHHFESGGEKTIKGLPYRAKYFPL